MKIYLIKLTTNYSFIKNYVKNKERIHKGIKMLFKLKKLKENNSKEVVELLKEYRETTFSEKKIKEILKNYPSVGK